LQEEFNMNHPAKWRWIAVCLIALTPVASHAVFTVEVTRFGGCVGPTPAGCVFDIPDNGPLDNNAALDVIDFSLPIVGQAPTVFSASGRATQTIGRDDSGRVTSILLQLTDTTVQGQSGARIGGQIGLISGEPLRALAGVSGFASLDGEYRSFTSGVIDHANLLLQARLGGLLLGLVDPPAVNGVLSPSPFSGFDSRSFGLPVSNLLFGVFDFEIAAGSGFVLPASGEAFAREIPEPSTLWLMPLGLLALALRRRARDCLTPL
jgi:hypothetical protein